MDIETRVQILEGKVQLLPEVKSMKKHLWNREQVETIKKEVLAFFRIFPGRLDLDLPIPPGDISLQQEGKFWLSNHSRIQVEIWVSVNDDDIEAEIFTYKELSGLSAMLKKYPRVRYPKVEGQKP